MLKDRLFEILSSQARCQVLNTLFSFGFPLPLRHIEMLTGLAIRSVQVAVNGLEKEKVLLKSKRGNKKLYRINKSNELFKTLYQIFTLIEKNNIEKRVQNYNSAARASLKFTDELLAMKAATRK